MYMFFAVEPYKVNGVKNLFRDFGDLTFHGRLPGGRQGYDFELWELEFESGSAELIGAVLRSLSGWDTGLQMLVELVETDYTELWDLITSPVPKHPSVSWCVGRYLKHFPNCWRDYWSSVGKCLVVPDDFLRFMRHYGAISAEQEASGYAGISTHYRSDRRHAMPDFPAEVHRVVRVGRLRIDFTRRQYKSDAPVPTVWVCRDSSQDVYPQCSPS